MTPSTSSPPASTKKGKMVRKRGEVVKKRGIRQTQNSQEEGGGQEGRNAVKREEIGQKE